MSSRALASSLLLALSLAACSEEPPRRLTPAAGHGAAPATEAAPPPAEELPAPRDVTFTTTDGVTIGGTLYRAARVDAPAVVLVHQVGSARTEWGPLVERLHVAPAFTTLAIDLRGHGTSTHATSGTIDWQTMSDAQWAATALDVRAAVDYLASQESGVAPASFAAVGSSIGASAVVAAAADDPRLANLVTLSPGRAYHGFDAITPAAQLDTRSIFAIASRDEEDSAATAQAYSRITGVPVMIVDGDAHGVLIFGTTPSTLAETEDFLREHLGWVRLVPRDDSVAPTAPPPVTSPGTPVPE